MDGLDVNILKNLARKYIWWKTPNDASKMPEHIIAQVMDIGDYDDVQTLAKLVGDDILRKVLVNAEIGQFRPRSWTYWHYRLNLADATHDAPPMPTRKLS